MDHGTKEDYSPAFYPVVFWTYLGPIAFFLFPISTFEIEMFVLYLSHHCILEVDNLFDFTGS
jgi:hypothetical protein